MTLTSFGEQEGSPPSAGAGQLLDRLNAFEQDFPVDQWTIDGIHVWPLVRIHLALEFYRLRLSVATSKPSSERRHGRIARLLARQLRFFRASWNDHEHNLWRLRPTAALFLSDGVSFSKVHGRYYERFCDPIRDYLESLGVESTLLTPTDKFLVPRYSRSAFVQPWLEWAAIRRRLRIARRGTSESLPGYASFEAAANREFAGALPSLPSIRTQVALIEAYARYFETVVDRVRPRACFLVSYYWLVGYGLLLASRRSGIPAIDIQHGATGELHPAYCRWLRVPPGGYGLLPSVFWCWTQTEAEGIERWSSGTQGAHRAIDGGNVFLEMWRADSSYMVAECDEILARKRAALGTPLHVLVTLQASLVTDELVALLSGAIAETSGSVSWWLRLHPGMLEERRHIAQILGGHRNVEIDGATDLPLYALLRQVDVHVTHCSSVVVEAEAFGVCSVVCSPYGIELFPTQARAGTAVYAASVAELKAAVDRQSGKRRPLESVKSAGNRRLEHAFAVLRSELELGFRGDRPEARCA